MERPEEKGTPQEHAYLGDLNRSIIDHSPVGIVTFLQSGKIVDMNPTSKSILGISEIEKPNLRSFIPPESEIGFRNDMQRLAAGEKVHTEYVIMDSRGERRFTRFTMLPFDGNSALAMIEDITSIKATEHSMRIYRQNIETFLDNARDYVIFQLRNIRENRLPEVAFVSPSIVDIGGIPADKRKDMKSWIDGLSESTVRRFRDAGKELKQPPYSVCLQFEYNHPEKGNLWLTMSASGVVDESGQLTSINGFFHDLTALRRTEHRLRLSEEKFRLMARNVSDVIWTCDKNFRFTWVSPSVRATLGYNPGEFIDLSIEDTFDRQSIEDLQEKLNLVYLENFTKHTEESRGSFNLRIEFRHRLGHFVQTEIGFTVIHYYDDEFFGLIGTTRDITPTLEYEKKLWAMNNTLEEANQKLKTTQSTMIRQEKMASIGHISAGLTHAIPTTVSSVSSIFATMKRCISSIDSFVSQFSTELDAVSNSNCRIVCPVAPKLDSLREQTRLDFIIKDLVEMLNDSDDGLARMRDIVQNLRKFSHQGNSNDFRETDINEVIKNALTIARNQLKYVADVTTDLSADRPLMAMPGELGQVFLNLIVNAGHAVEETGNRGCISISSQSLGDCTIITVSDNGPGVPDEHVNRIFDPFYTTKEPGKGTGLGLYISYDIIVNKHSGQIQVGSSQFGGAEFIVTLPNSPRPAGDDD